MIDPLFNHKAQQVPQDKVWETHICLVNIAALLYVSMVSRDVEMDPSALCGL